MSEICSETYAVEHTYVVLLECIRFFILYLEEYGPCSSDQLSKCLKFFSPKVSAIVNFHNGVNEADKLTNFLYDIDDVFIITTGNIISLLETSESLIEVIRKDIVLIKTIALVRSGISNISEIIRNLNLSLSSSVDAQRLTDYLEEDNISICNQQVTTTKSTYLSNWEEQICQCTTRSLQEIGRMTCSEILDVVKQQQLSYSVNELFVFSVLYSKKKLFFCENGYVSLRSINIEVDYPHNNSVVLKSRNPLPDTPTSALVSKLYGTHIKGWIGRVKHLRPRSGYIYVSVDLQRSRKEYFQVYFYKTCVETVCNFRTLSDVLNIHDDVIFDAIFDVRLTGLNQDKFFWRATCVCLKGKECVASCVNVHNIYELPPVVKTSVLALPVMENAIFNNPEIQHNNGVISEVNHSVCTEYGSKFRSKCSMNSCIFIFAEVILLSEEEGLLLGHYKDKYYYLFFIKESLFMPNFTKSENSVTENLCIGDIMIAFVPNFEETLDILLSSFVCQVTCDLGRLSSSDCFTNISPWEFFEKCIKPLMTSSTVNSWDLVMHHKLSLFQLSSIFNDLHGKLQNPNKKICNVSRQPKYIRIKKSSHFSFGCINHKAFPIMNDLSKLEVFFEVSSIFIKNSLHSDSVLITSEKIYNSDIALSNFSTNVEKSAKEDIATDFSHSVSTVKSAMDNRIQNLEMKNMNEENSSPVPLDLRFSEQKTDGISDISREKISRLPKFKTNFVDQGRSPPRKQGSKFFIQEGHGNFESRMNMKEDKNINSSELMLNSSNLQTFVLRKSVDIHGSKTNLNCIHEDCQSDSPETVSYSSDTSFLTCQSSSPCANISENEEDYFSCASGLNDSLDDLIHGKSKSSKMASTNENSICNPYDSLVVPKDINKSLKEIPLLETASDDRTCRIVHNSCINNSVFPSNFGTQLGSNLECPKAITSNVNWIWENSVPHTNKEFCKNVKVNRFFARKLGAFSVSHFGGYRYLKGSICKKQVSKFKQKQRLLSTSKSLRDVWVRYYGRNSSCRNSLESSKTFNAEVVVITETCILLKSIESNIQIVASFPLAGIKDICVKNAIHTGLKVKMHVQPFELCKYFMEVLNLELSNCA